MLRRVTIIAIVVGGVAAAAPWWHRAAPRELAGWSLYDRYCLACHGGAGDGRGPAAPYTWGRPRDFTHGDFHWRSTATGQSPSRDDLLATLRFGAPGTSMPGFDQILSPAQLDDLAEVVVAFGPAQASSTPIALGPPPPRNPLRGAELWNRLGCASCHGAQGKGDGAAAKTMAEPPFDLTAVPLRRPRATDDRDARRRAAALDIAAGMSAMPGYAGTIPDADIWALADLAVTLGERATRRDRSALDAIEIAADRKVRIATGRWPGHDDDEAVMFGGPIEAQGPPPVALAPAEASLDARQCARCHAKQYREWHDSIHGAAASPGLLAQIDYMPEKQAASCRRCHAPLAEQAEAGRLRGEGVQCAGCHVRGWTRRGPPYVERSLLPDPSYPLVTLALYERADFCLPCHQLAPRDAVSGKPLLNTYKEWLEGPYMRRGIQCQHCHMPDREHAFLGIHDPHTLRQGIELTASAHRADRGVTVLAELRNIGAGHFLPTTPTPALWLVIELVDAKRQPIAGATARLRIGRDVAFDGTAWHEREDTRIPPGERVTMARAWSGGRTAQATRARISVEVHPDEFYEHFYEAKLASELVVAQRTLYQQALDRARRSHYVGETQEIVIAP